MEKKKNRVKKPNFFVYTIPTYIMKAFARFYWGMKTDNKEIRKIKSPVLALAPHSSTLDILPVAATLLPKRYNVVMGKDLLTWKQLKPFIKSFGAIPKDQCSIDIECIRTMKRAIQQGNNLLLYPEGKTSLDGKEMFFLSPAIGKLIKMFGCTVVLVKTNGAYLTKPRYIHGFRRGKIETKASLLFTAEEVKSLSPQEITAKVREAMRFNDHIWQWEKKIFFKADDMANNLSYILYKCPQCGSEYEMKAENGHLTCQKCGNDVTYTGYGDLIASEGSKTFDRLDLWVDFERAEIDKEIAREDFSLCKKVTVQNRNDQTNKYDDCGEGELLIDKEKIEFSGTVNGETITLPYKITDVPTIVTKNSEGVDLVFGGKTYRFLFVEKKWSAKYGLIVERLFAQRNNLSD